MAQEIERKFKVCSDAWRQEANAGEILQQGYLSVDPARTVRIRVGEGQASLTVKGEMHGLAREEFEYKIPFEDAQRMVETLCLQPVVSKTRYLVPVGDDCWEVDEFGGDNSPLVLAELETESEQAPEMWPTWVGSEVTEDPKYRNYYLVTHPYSTWAYQDTVPRFHLRPDEAVGCSLQRIVDEQFAAALAIITEPNLEEAVHGTRKCIKRIRAVLRLMRPILGARYAERNAQLRAFGRELSDLRDTHALIETLDALKEKYPSAFEQYDLADVRQVLLDDREAREQAFDHDRHIPALVSLLKSLRKGAAGWPFAGMRIRRLAKGVATTIKQGRARYREALSAPTPENFHAWRRRAKDLGYQLTLLQKLQPEVFKQFLKSAKRLEESLGMDHNLAVLRARLAGNRNATAPDSSAIVPLIDAYQCELRAEADALGKRLYLEKGKEWTRRVRHGWKVGRKTTETRK